MKLREAQVDVRSALDAHQFDVRRLAKAQRELREAAEAVAHSEGVLEAAQAVERDARREESS